MPRIQTCPEAAKITIWSMQLLLLVLAADHTAMAQTEPASGSGSSAIRPGAWALQFQIDQDTILRSFEGSVLSAKHHLSETSSLRLGLSLDLHRGDGIREITTLRERLADSAAVADTDEYDRDERGFYISAQYVRNSSPSRPLVTFVGGGPYVQYTQGDSDYASTTDASAEYYESMTRSDESRYWSLGVVAILGVEWFPMRRISLHAEYGLRLGHTWTKTLRVDDRTREIAEPIHDHAESEIRTNSWIVEGSAIKLGLSVYL
ncbi:MAG: hypothetical protein GF330_12500 [Candidatus Eisenbacteria bacterium]|nr:hypothetical protein [Candidatus Eisenbacteria bacterium]